MADEGNQNLVGEMDLNLNLGLPPSYLNGVIDLGSALTINSSSTAEENSDLMKSPEPEVPYSPSNAVPDAAGSLPMADEGVAVGPLVPIHTVPPRSFVVRDVLTVEDDPAPVIAAVQPSSPVIGPAPLTPEGRHEVEQTLRLLFVDDPSLRAQRLMETDNQRRGQGSEEAPEAKDDGHSDFECNICFETAKEPVVTSCGHLFCWPCLYEWLHRNLDIKECPMCKGELLRCNITPIYGRGSWDNGKRSEALEKGKEGFLIPPRPRGNRYEGFNQWFEPILEVADEDTMSSWRSLVDEGMRTVFQRVVEPSMREMFNTCYQRLMETQTEQGDYQVGESIGEMLSQRSCPRGPQSSNHVVTAPHYPSEDFLWQWFTLCGLAKTQRLTALANLDAMFHRITTGLGGNSAVVAAAFGEEEDHACASSTMAVIQGGGALSSAPTEPNTSESSGSLRRSRSGVPGFSGEDGEGDHANTRRRLN